MASVPIRLGVAAAVALVVAAYAVAVAGRVQLMVLAPTPWLTDRHGRFLAQLGHGGAGDRVEYGYWSAGPPPDRVVRATLALEDRRFWQHPGVDPVSVLRAAWQDLPGLRRRSGASTLAMQVARMQRPAPRTLWAKAVEAGTALALTLRYGRQAVLAQYLRLVPYGNGSHGIAHAARFYFDRPVADLSWAQIALLCAVPQAPTGMNPLHADGLVRAKVRARRILVALEAQAVLTAPEHDAALSELAALAPRAPRRPSDALHLVARLRGMLAPPGSAPPDPAGPRVTASLDLAVQDQVAGSVRQLLAEWGGAGAQQAAVLVLRRDTREVVAAVGSGEYGGVPGGAIDFTRTVRSPGSTLKPFLYALALQRGVLSPMEVLDDRPEGAAGIGNADGQFLGPLLPRQALANSRNTPAVTVLRRLGLDSAFGLFRDLGLHEAAAPASSFGLSMAIGSLPTSLDRLAGAYGVLADDGVLRPPIWYRGQPAVPPRRILSTEAAREVALFLSDPLARLPSFPRYGSTEFPFAAALKTGTSQAYRDAWTVAWSGRWQVAVWVGRPDGAPMAGLGGARVAAGLARTILLRLHGTQPGDLAENGFPPPPGWSPVALCAGRPGPDGCGPVLMEWVPRQDGRPRAPDIASPVAAPPPDGRPATDVPVQISIVAPDQNTRLWRNPEMPPAQDKLVLRAQVSPAVPQLVWYVDGEPFAMAGPDEPVFWPMLPGAHRFQIRLPSRAEASRLVRVVVE